MKKLATILLALVAIALPAQTHRITTVDLYTGDPTGVACSPANKVVQSTTTGLFYSCVGGYYSNGALFNGGPVTNPIVLPSDPTLALHAVTKQYVDAPLRGRTLNAFGDSITLGTGAVPSSNSYVNVLAAQEGWIVNNQGIGGDQVFDQWSHVYATAVTSSTISSMLIGQNDGNNVRVQTNGEGVWSHALMGIYGWLLLPNKITAQNAAVTTTGTWANSDLTSIGLKTTAQNSTVQAKVFGTTVYVALMATLNNAATFKVTVDGVDYTQTYSPATTWTGRASSTAPWLVRIPGLQDIAHTVTVTDTGVSGTIYVDWFAGNHGQLTATGPYLYVGTPYLSNMADSDLVYLRRVITRAVQAFADDGLGISLADVAGACQTQSGTALCNGSDGVHPNNAGHAIIATAFAREVNTPSNTTPRQGGRSFGVRTPEIVFTYWNAGATNNNAYQLYMVPQQTMTIDRVHINLPTQLAGCTTQPNVQIVWSDENGSSKTSVLGAIPNAAGNADFIVSDVRPAGGSNLWFNFAGAAGCTNFGTSGSAWVIQYHNDGY